MGHVGIMIQCLIGQNLICYELDGYKEENNELFINTVNFIDEYTIHPKINFKELFKELTDKNLQINNETGILKHYGGGAGNNAFINKEINLKIKNNYFIYSKDSINYKIFCSCYGVFLAVSGELKSEAGIIIQYPIPKIGIFWLHYKNSKVEIYYYDLIERDLGEKYNNFLIYPNGHYEIWETLKNYDLVPKSSNYEDLPRGRIAYDNLKNEYVIYCGNWIDSTPGIKTLIKSEFKLRNSFRWEKDYHYKKYKRWGY